MVSYGLDVRLPRISKCSSTPRSSNVDDVALYELLEIASWRGRISSFALPLIVPTTKTFSVESHRGTSFLALAS